MTFAFDVDLAKAEEQDGQLFLEGVASTTDLDKQRERMSPDALADMAKAVGIPLTDSHTNELANEIGQIVESRLEGDKLVIKARMFADDPVAVRLWKAVQRGSSKAGFSVGGNITSHKLSPNKDEKRIITGVQLDHIMLTKKPANPMTFATALTKSMEELEHLQELRESDVSRVTKTGDTMDKQDDLAKAGAKFSADTVSALKDIHDSGNANVKAKVRSLLGDQADGVLGDNPDSDTSSVDDQANGSEDKTGGVIAGKTEAVTATLAKEDVEKLKADLRKEIGDEVMAAFKDGLKQLAPVLKGQHNIAKGPSITSDAEKAFSNYLGKVIR